MKLEKNMYVRLNCNYELGIGKVISKIDEDNFIRTKFKNDFECSLPTYMITKASHNIIDLIEYDDILKIIYEDKEYICKVVNVGGIRGVQLTSTLSVGLGIVEAVIKSIVTKEQFSAMEYKVGEE